MSVRLSYILLVVFHVGSNLKLLLLLAMKPSFGQQQVEEWALGTDMLLADKENIGKTNQPSR